MQEVLQTLAAGKMEKKYNSTSHSTNKTLLYFYNHLYSPLLYKLFNKIKIDSFSLTIDDKSIPLPLASPEKLLFDDTRGKRVLDIGTGCGIIALIAKKMGARYVLGIDINPNAITNAEKNLKLNLKDLKNINFVLSDIFQNVHGKFDIIVSNPPFFNKEPRNIGECKHNCKNVIEKILRDGKKHLNKKGEIRILFPASEATAISNLAIKHSYKLRIFPHNLSKRFHISMLRLFFQLTYRPKINIYIFEIDKNYRLNSQ